jgi:hypothetical protein
MSRGSPFLILGRYIWGRSKSIWDHLRLYCSLMRIPVRTDKSSCERKRGSVSLSRARSSSSASGGRPHFARQRSCETQNSRDRWNKRFDYRSPDRAIRGIFRTDPKKNPNKRHRSLFWRRRAQLQPESPKPAPLEDASSAVRPWYRPTPLKVSVVVLGVLAILPTHANGQSGIDTAFEERMSIEDFRGLISGEAVTREMFEECQLVNSIYGDIASRIVLREDEFKQQLKNAQAQWEAVRGKRGQRKEKISLRETRHKQPFR